MVLLHLSLALLISPSLGLVLGDEFPDVQQEIEQISKEREIGNYFSQVQAQVDL